MRPNGIRCSLAIIIFKRLISRLLARESVPIVMTECYLGFFSVAARPRGWGLYALACSNQSLQTASTTAQPQATRCHWLHAARLIALFLAACKKGTIRRPPTTKAFPDHHAVREKQRSDRRTGRLQVKPASMLPIEAREHVRVPEAIQIRISA